VARLGALEKARRVCVFGFGGKGRELAGRLRSLGIEVVVRDASKAAQAVALQEGYEIVDPTSADLSMPTILGAGQKQIEQRDMVGENYVYYQEACDVFDLPCLYDRCRDFSSFVTENVDELGSVLVLLDAESAEVFAALLEYRVSLQPESLAGLNSPDGSMWFDVPREHGSRPYGTFLDVGAFDGDTLIAASEWLGIDRAIAIEANPELASRLTAVGERLARGVAVESSAAWSHATMLSFEEVRGGMITVRESSGGGLAADAIDNYVHESVDLAKMDIEGAEARALAGARRVLSEGTDWAVAAYHRPEDLLSLPTMMRDGLAGEYRLMFRHYSEVFDDSIFYFLRTM
jgi:FkbM family methyltransferase